MDQPQQPQHQSSSSTKQALLECDLVMKGGVTSGIVYPPLIVRLHERYRFRSIGGSSAGAIAAAGAAAAELGREQGGFAKLSKMQQQLAKNGFLRGLFQPSAQLAPLLDIALDAKALFDKRGQGGRLRWHRLADAYGLVCQHLPAVHAAGSRRGLMGGLGAAVVLSASCVLVWLAFELGSKVPAEPWRPLTLLAILVGLALAALAVWAGRLAGSLWALGHELSRLVSGGLPAHWLGLCSGRGPASGGTPLQPALTDWLHERFEDMAGTSGRADGKPLTFGDLWAKPFDDERQNERDLSPNSRKSRNIDLKMFTTNLNQYQPYVLPFEDHPFIFHAAEFRAFFPDSVVNYMVQIATRVDPKTKEPCDPRVKRFALPTGYYFLPEAADLPVIVATRLSLSFPVLLCAVPLYTVDPSLDQARTDHSQPIDVPPDKLQKNWFSDGGICSNFPIHFFDEWLPSHPTFGVNLTAMPDKALQPANGHAVVDPSYIGPVRVQPGAALQPQEDIVLPKPDAPSKTEFVPFEAQPGSGAAPSLARFLQSVFTTAQVFRDNDQAMLPSYRERVVQVRLKRSEGGLNLAMSGPAIQNIINKGERAADKLLNEFDFDAHRWVRFRVLTREMEHGLLEMRKQLLSNPQGGPSFYMNMLGKPSSLARMPYCPHTSDLNAAIKLNQWCIDASNQLNQLNGVIAQWQATTQQPPQSALFAQELAPIPRAVLRVMPNL